jgi:hypothetical protein
MPNPLKVHFVGATVLPETRSICDPLKGRDAATIRVAFAVLGETPLELQ